MKYTSMLQLANQSLPHREREVWSRALIPSAEPGLPLLRDAGRDGLQREWRGEQHLFSFPHIPSLQLWPTPGPGAALRALAGGGKTENKWQLHFYSEGGWRGEEGGKDGWIDGEKRNSFQVAKGIDRGTTSFKATCRAVVPVGFYFFAPCAEDRNSRTLLLKLTILNFNLFHYYLFIYLFRSN